MDRLPVGAATSITTADSPAGSHPPQVIAGAQWARGLIALGSSTESSPPVVGHRSVDC